LTKGTPENNNLIIFGQDHDSKYGSSMMSDLPPEAVGVMDRGFAGLEFIKKLTEENKYFVLRIQNSWKLEFDEETELTKVGTTKNSGLYRVVHFCDIETEKEYRLVTNLPAPDPLISPEEREKDAGVSDEEVMEIYRCRWGVELLWKFLKMHLKLDRLITKNVNGITIQIYSSLIAYLILQLIEIPEQWGEKIIDKYRYLQSCMNKETSYIHWIDGILPC
jgi:putative transposase